MQAYILLCPELFLQKYGKPMIQTCQYLLADIRTEGIVIICKLFITMLKAQPAYAVELLHPVLINVMKNLLGDSDYLSIKQIYLQVSTRYFLANQLALSRVLEEVGVENSLQKFLAIWLETMPGVTQNEDKKLLAIGLCSLLTVANDLIFESFSAIIINVYETLCDIMKADAEDEEEKDSLVLNDIEIEIEMEDYEYKTAHYDRLKAVCLKDPVHVLILKDYLQSQVCRYISFFTYLKCVAFQLVSLKKLVGDEKYAGLMATVDITIQKQLYNYVNTLVPVIE